MKELLVDCNNKALTSDPMVIYCETLRAVALATRRLANAPFYQTKPDVKVAFIDLALELDDMADEADEGRAALKGDK